MSEKLQIEKIVIYPKFSIPEMASALNALSSKTHSRNIAYSLQFLKYCESLIKDHINIKYAIDTIFSKAMTVIVSSVIECLLFDSLIKNNITQDKWIHYQGPTILPIFNEDKTKRIRVIYEKKEKINLDKFTFFSKTIELACNNKIIKNGLKSDLNIVKNARDLIHIRGAEKLDLKEINLEYYLKNIKPALIKVMKELNLNEAIKLFES